MRPFIEEEERKTVFDMKENTTPSPDGFGVSFYKRCWNTIKGEIMDLINDFYMGQLDIARLNYGVITLIPKVEDANNVKQFRPICLLNVSFKIFTKLMLGRLSTYAASLTSPSQTTFVKGDTYQMVRSYYMKLCMNSKLNIRGGDLQNRLREGL